MTDSVGCQINGVSEKWHRTAIYEAYWLRRSSKLCQRNNTVLVLYFVVLCYLYLKYCVVIDRMCLTCIYNSILKCDVHSEQDLLFIMYIFE